jgi:hypothetical protein
MFRTVRVPIRSLHISDASSARTLCNPLIAIDRSRTHPLERSENATIDPKYSYFIIGHTFPSLGRCLAREL